jgi:basic amino acid/polyamine antiporter, APA family
VPVLRKRHPETRSYFCVPGGPYLIPYLAAAASVGLMYYLKVGNPVVWGFFPIVWLTFIVWLAIGLVVYFSYGRRKSKVAANVALSISKGG